VSNLPEETPARAPGEGDSTISTDGDGLVSRLRVIEDQPLEQRSEAYAALHAELKAVLDSADRTAG
jgi:hypothetical protein